MVPQFKFLNSNPGKPYELLALKALLRSEEPFEASFGVLKPNPIAVFDTSLGAIEAEIFLDAG